MSHCQRIRIWALLALAAGAATERYAMMRKIPHLNEAVLGRTRDRQGTRKAISDAQRASRLRARDETLI